MALINNPFEQDNNLSIDFDPNYMPAMPQAPQSNALVAGLKAGNDQFWGTTLGAGSALIGKLVGSEGLSNWGERYKAAADAASERDGRADLETSPWREGGGGWGAALPWLVYQGAKQVPQMAVGLGAAMAAAPVAAPIAAATGLARGGAALGGALGFGAEASAQLGARAIAGGAALYPNSAGSLYEQAIERQQAGGDKATSGDAAKAAIMGVPYALAEGMMPAILPGIFAHGAEQAAKGGFKEGAKAVLKGVGLGAAEEMPTEAVQTAMEMSFRNDLSTEDKAQQIVDAALTGGAIGGLFGGLAHGAGRFKTATQVAPGTVDTPGLKDAVDEQLGLLPPPSGTNPGFVDPNAGPDQKSAMPVNAGGVAGANLYQHDLDAQATADADKLTPHSVAKQFERLDDGDLSKMLAVAEGNGDQVPAPVLSLLRAEQSRRAHSHMDDNALDAQISGTQGTIEKMQAEGMDLPAGITQQLDTLGAEKARRAGLEPTSLFGEQELRKAQEKQAPAPQEEPSEARAARVNAEEMRNRTLELLGTDGEGKQVRPNQWLTKLTQGDTAPQTNAELAHAVMDRLASKQGKNDTKALAIAQRLGLVDENGQQIDHASNIAGLQTDLATMRVQRLAANPNDDLRTPVATMATGPNASVETDGVAALQKQIANQRAAQALAQEVQQRRAGGSAVEPQAPTEANVSSGPAPATQMTLQTARPTGFVDTRNYLRDAAGGSPAAHSAARQMAPRDLPEAVQGTLAYLGEKSPKSWSKVYRTWGEHFGLIEGGKLLSIPEAIRNTQGKIEQAQRLGDGGTLGQLTQRLDALTGAQTAREDAPPTAPLHMKAGAEQATGGRTEEGDFRQTQLRQAMHTVEQDPASPSGLRARAQQARTAINQRAATAEDQAHSIMAEYASRTGNNLAAPSLGAEGRVADAMTKATDLSSEGRPARIAARWRGGDVVYSRGDIHLVRTTNAFGNDVYSPYHNGRDWLGNFDVTSEKYDKDQSVPFTKDELTELRNASKNHAEQERDLNDENPDGPFARMEAGSNVVASKSVSPALADTLNEWVQMLGMDHTRIMLVHPDDVRTAEHRAENGLYGKFGNIFQINADNFGETNRLGARPGDHYIMVRPDLSEGVQVETMAHEMGHIVEKEIISRLPKETANAILAAHKAWLQEKKGLSAPEFVRALRSAQSGAALADNMRPDTKLRESYYHSFGEWWADQVAKWATTSEKPVGVVEKFFAKVGDYLKMLMRVYKRNTANTADRMPVKEVKDFLDKMADTRNAKSFLAEFGATIRTSNTEQVTRPSAMAAPGLGPKLANQKAEEAVSTADRYLGILKSKFDDVRLKSFPEFLGFLDVNHMAVQMEKRGFDQVRLYEQAHEYRQALGIRFVQLLHTSIQQFEAAPQNIRDTINNVMRATEFNIDPRKSWAENKHLHNEPNARDLKAAHAQFQKAWNDLGRVEQGKYQALYNDLHNGNNAVNHARMSMLTHYAVSSNPEVQDTLKFADPSDRFLADDSLHEEPARVAAFWRTTLDAQQATLEKYLDEQRGQLTDAKTRDATAIARKIDALQKIWERNKITMDAMDRAPNFHLGRHGEYFVAFDMRTIGGTGENAETVNPVALRKVAEAIKDAGFDVQLSKENTQKSVYVRVEDPSTAQRLENILRGDLKNFVTAETIQQGKRSNNPEFNNKISPEWLQQVESSVKGHFDSMIARAEDEKASDVRLSQLKEMRDHSVSILRDTYLDSLPDSAIAKVLVHRNSVPGYNPDMFRNNGFRMQVGINSLASMAASPRILGAMTAMRQQVETDKHDPKLSVKQRTQRQMVLEELDRRESERAINNGQSWVDFVRAFNHNWYLGLNPAYAALNMMQVGITTLPELAKNGGFIKAMQTMAKNSGAAMRVVTETWKAGLKMGWRHIGDGTVTREILKNAGLTQQQAFIVQQLVNKGAIDLGGQTRQLGQVVDRPSSEGNLREKIENNFAGGMRLASSFGLYTEMFSRLVAGLSAAEMAPKGVDPVAHARQVIKDTLYDYNSWNSPRHLGKNGLLGKATPAVLAFHNYSAFTMMKLGREFADVYSGTPAQRKEALTFLGGHMAALTVFTGTLGLPFASVVIRAAELMKDMFDGDDQPWDLKASYRQWLAGIFGKTAGEMISHGVVSRALGQEVTARAGEQDLLPFSKLLTDKRKFEDAVKDFGSRGWGAPVSMATSMIEGMGQVGKGDVMKGMMAMMPISIQNIMKAGDLAQNGYTDKNGQRLPVISPGAGDIVNQALGFMPANKAEYNEEAFAYRQRKGQIGAESTELRQKIAVAIERGDQDTARKLMDRATEFDKNNPAYAVLPRLASTIQSRAKARAMAEATHLPVGVNMKDIDGIGTLGFANY